MFSYFHGFNAEKYHLLNIFHYSLSKLQIFFQNFYEVLTQSSQYKHCFSHLHFHSRLKILAVFSDSDLGICSDLKEKLRQKPAYNQNLELRVDWFWILGINTLLSSTMDKIFKKLTLDQAVDNHFSCGIVGAVDILMTLLIDLWYRCKPHADLTAWMEENPPILAFMLFIFICFPCTLFDTIDYSISLTFRNQILDSVTTRHCANIASFGGNMTLRTVETSVQAISTKMDIHLMEITDKLFFLYPLRATFWTYIISKFKLIENSYQKMYKSLNYKARRFNRNRLFIFRKLSKMVALLANSISPNKPNLSVLQHFLVFCCIFKQYTSILPLRLLS